MMDVTADDANSVCVLLSRTDLELSSTANSGPKSKSAGPSPKKREKKAGRKYSDQLQRLLPRYRDEDGGTKSGPV